jgi:hypothetical protein
MTCQYDSATRLIVDDSLKNVSHIIFVLPDVTNVSGDSIRLSVTAQVESDHVVPGQTVELAARLEILVPASHYTVEKENRLLSVLPKLAGPKNGPIAHTKLKGLCVGSGWRYRLRLCSGLRRE